MSGKEELKKRLEKQLSKKGSLSVLKKKKSEKKAKKPKVESLPKKVPELISTKNLEKKTEDDEEFRKYISDILEEKFLDNDKNLEKVYKLFKKKYESSKKKDVNIDEGFEFLDAEIRNAWESLEDNYKLEYILESLSIGAPWQRKTLINNLLKLNYDLQENYMKSYLKQDKLSYDSFYESWSSRPGIKNEIEKIFSDKIEGSQGREEIIKADITQNAKKYAERKGIDINKEIGVKTVSIGKSETQYDLQPSYYNILKRVGKKEGKDIEKLHKKFAKEWIFRAQILGISEPEKLQISDLSNEIKRKEEELYRDPQYNKLKSLSREELERLLDNEDIDYPDDILIIKILKKKGAVQVKKSKSFGGRGIQADIMDIGKKKLIAK